MPRWVRYRTRFWVVLILAIASLASMATGLRLLGRTTELRISTEVQHSLQSQAQAQLDAVPAPPRLLRVVVVGDSSTKGSDTAASDFATGMTGPMSWTHYLEGGNVLFLGGQAANDLSADLAEVASPYPTADVLVLMVGLDDFLAGIPLTTTAENLATIVSRSGVRNVLVLRIPPVDLSPVNSSQFAEGLQDFAASKGWFLADPIASLRDQGRYIAGNSDDGIHLNSSGAAKVGAAVLAELDVKFRVASN